MDKFSIYIHLIIFIKVLFFCFATSHLYLKVKGKAHSETDEKILFWKTRIEFIFIILIAFLLIYLFNPTSNMCANLDKETKLLLCLFGFILLITANWSVVIKENTLFKQFQTVV